MNKETLVKMEAWKISPKVTNGQKAYSQDDITLGKLIVEMGNIGLGVKDGFERDHSRCIKVAIRFLGSEFLTDPNFSPNFSLDKPVVHALD